MGTATYNPRKIKITGPGISITGVAKGTFVKASVAEDTWKLELGAQGAAVRTQSFNLSGMIELTLQAASPSNKKLSDLAKRDRTDGTGIGDWTIEDLNGNTLWAGEGWVTKPADLEYGDEHGNRDWKIQIAEWTSLDSDGITV